MNMGYVSFVGPFKVFYLNIAGAICTVCELEYEKFMSRWWLDEVINVIINIVTLSVANVPKPRSMPDFFY